MLAEIFILRLESAFRYADGQTSPSSDKRFVPIKPSVSHMTNGADAAVEKRTSG
jgi:hypothetical protein